MEVGSWGMGLWGWAGLTEAISECHEATTEYRTHCREPLGILLSHEEPQAGDWREGHACLQLWIVAASGSGRVGEGGPVRSGPGVVEDVLTVRVRFQV